jgi:hypothetical protein
MPISQQQGYHDESVVHNNTATGDNDADFVRNKNSSTIASASNAVNRDLWQDPSLVASQRAQAAQVSSM